MKYCIWSNRKRMWWGPNRAGYTDNLARAGEYTQAEASTILFGSLSGANIPVDRELVNNHLLNATPAEIQEKLKQWSTL